ncbi:MAG: aminopeptidase [Clostridia bacterium]|nr:aminopeptidase [Clostridia bacterium]
MLDPRVNKLAKNLINYSCRLKKGEKVLIESYDAPNEIVLELVKEAQKVGAFPFVERISLKVKRELIKGSNKEFLNAWKDMDLERMKQMDAYIAIRGGDNSFELSDIPEDKMGDFETIYSNIIVNERVDNTKWVVLRWPTSGMSQFAQMSTEQFEDYYFNVCNLDYSKMSKAMDSLESLMKRTDKVRIVSPNTDLSFSIKNIGAVKCAGECNIPDGEVYTAPVKTSVNGVIQYNTPTIYGGKKFDSIRLEFKDGKIINASCKEGDINYLNKFFSLDEGAKYVGEFAIGVNPFVKHPMCDILFDEKICGSIHFTPGCCYEDCPNGNKSALHWDLVLIQREEYGGGEIYFDDVLIRKNGIFVIDELKCLNPENLIK